jgi:hypothetical protein
MKKQKELCMGSFIFPVAIVKQKEKPNPKKKA